MPDNNQYSQRRPQYLYTIISVAAVLFLLGFFGLLLLQTKQLSKTLKEQVDIIVELVPESSKGERAFFTRQLNNSPFSLSGTVKYTPKEDALVLMSEELGEDHSKDKEIEELYAKIKKLKVSKIIKKKMEDEVKRLSLLASNSAESNVIRTYVNSLLDLPWNKMTKDSLKLSKLAFNLPYPPSWIR